MWRFLFSALDLWKRYKAKGGGHGNESCIAKDSPPTSSAASERCLEVATAGECIHGQSCHPVSQGYIWFDIPMFELYIIYLIHCHMGAESSRGCSCKILQRWDMHHNKICKMLKEEYRRHLKAVGDIGPGGPNLPWWPPTQLNGSRGLAASGSLYHSPCFPRSQCQQVPRSRCDIPWMDAWNGTDAKVWACLNCVSTTFCMFTFASRQLWLMILVPLFIYSNILTWAQLFPSEVYQGLQVQVLTLYRWLVAREASSSSGWGRWTGERLGVQGSLVRSPQVARCM